MIDKVVFVSMSEMVIIYTNRPPFTLRCDTNVYEVERPPFTVRMQTNVLKLYDWFMAPPGFKTLSQYNDAVKRSDEDTQVIEVAELDKEAA